MSILVFLLIFGLSIALIVLLVIINFIRNIFRFGRKNNNQDFFGNVNRGQSTQKKKKKIFGNNEGEYVDYEEIRDK